MELAHPGDSGAGASGGGARSLVGPYMLIDFVDDLPLETPENTEVQITTVEARGIFYYFLNQRSMLTSSMQRRTYT